MQQTIRTTVTQWGIMLADRIGSATADLLAPPIKRHLNGRKLALLLLLLISAGMTLWRGTESLHPSPDAKSAPVLCISAVQGADAVPQVVYQGASRTIDEAMREQGMGQLVEAGYTVTHQACFDRWQAAADFVTGGQVMLPEGVTERDFVMALLKWKQQHR